MKKKKFTIFFSKQEDITEYEEFASYAIVILLTIAAFAALWPWIVFFYNFTTF